MLVDDDKSVDGDAAGWKLVSPVGPKPAASAGSVGRTDQTLLSPLGTDYRADAGLTGALSL